MNLDEAQLIGRVLAEDDRHAFRQLVLMHQAAIRLFLRRILGDPALADDCAQETWLIAWQKLGSWRGGGFRSWLFTIALRKALRVKGQQGRLDFLESVDDQAAPMRTEGLRLDLEKAMQQLSVGERTCLHLMSCEEMTHEDISQLLGMPLGTVKSHINRGKEKLRKLLSGPAEEKVHARR
ncbi:RNA polymerase sigma factor [Oligoflexus tunisiensis]|uniref:RNA polymerase sigma factor n=1 Tax=Oligoflexus tunisiensis TaxID=708132 RepID=UPI00114CD2C0|nr:RNA polymerase sigma factor [Oligoflexus tunisiensis]